MAGIPRPSLPKGAKWCKIVRPEPGNRLKVIALTDRYMGCWTHWVGRTVYCPGPRECKCFSSNEAKCDRRWRGYLPCLLYLQPQLAALELTPAMATQLDLWRTQGVELRGELLVATRSGQRNNGPILLERDMGTPTRTKLPDWFDPTWCVLTILGVPHDQVAEMYKREESHLVIFREDLEPTRN